MDRLTIGSLFFLLLCSNKLFSGTLDIEKPNFEKKVNADVPLTIDGAKTISAEQLIKLLHAQKNEKKSLALIDARIKEDRSIAYIETSISLPDVDTNCQTLQKLITKFQQQIIFYCNGIQCGRSLKSVRVAKKCGYTNLYWFRGGIEEWLVKDYPYATE